MPDDEKPQPHPMDEIEMREAMRGFALGTRAYYLELVEQGFQPHEALTLTGKWIVGTAGGASSS